MININLNEIDLQIVKQSNGNIIPDPEIETTDFILLLFMFDKRNQ